MDVNAQFSLMSKYAAQRMYRIRGYLSRVDASLMTDIVLHQPKQNYRGNIFEIGVFFGRSYYLLAHSLADGERAFASDLFEMFGETDDGASLQLEKFKENAAIAGIDLDERDIIVRDSLNADPYSLKDRCGKVRFFSIDGGHSFNHVVADAAVADHVLADYGVIAFDDFFHPGYPEVTVAIFDFLKKHEDKYRFFAVTARKAYVCRSDYYDEYRGMVARSWTANRYATKQIKWHDSGFELITDTMKDRAREKLLDTVFRATRGFDRQVKLNAPAIPARRRKESVGSEA